MMNQKVEELRRRYPRFLYEKFSWNRTETELVISFRFKTEPDLTFEPEVRIKGIDPSNLDALPNSVIDNLCFHLGMVEALSYWKATCSPVIVIRAGFLNDEQLEWWLDLIQHGMGEYFFVNDIDFTTPDFVSFTVDAPPNTASGRYEGAEAVGQNLVLTSGGKDTALTLSILSAAGLTFDSLMLNPVRAAVDLALVTGARRHIIVGREIAPALLELNKQGFLNGHTPFSAYLAFLGVTCAVLFGHANVIVSNERSSDEGNVEFLDSEINHQYSKTLRFERTFQHYAAEHLAPQVRYFSFLRPLYDIQIMGLLASHPDALSIFKSCNRNQKQNSWCSHCPKCLSVYIMMCPFVGRNVISRILNQEPFEDAENIKIVRELAGITGHKPFECVGTRRETIAGLYLGLRKFVGELGQLPPVWRHVETEILPRFTDHDGLVADVLTAWSDRHTLPPYFEELLRRQFKVSLGKNVNHETRRPLE